MTGGAPARARPGWLVLYGAVGALSACSAPPPARTVTLAALAAAPRAPATALGHVLVANPAALRPLCRPLGPRLALVQVRSAQEWQRFSRAAPQAGPQPDFSSGTLVGLVSWAGTALDGAWPVELEAIQVHDGGGLLKANFRGGTYLPDGTAHLVTTYVRDLQVVLVVEVNGTSFYPNSPD